MLCLQTALTPQKGSMKEVIEKRRPEAKQALEASRRQASRNVRNGTDSERLNPAQVILFKTTNS